MFVTGKEIDQLKAYTKWKCQCLELGIKNTAAVPQKMLKQAWEAAELLQNHDQKIKRITLEAKHENCNPGYFFSWVIHPQKTKRTADQIKNLEEQIKKEKKVIRDFLKFLKKEQDFLNKKLVYFSKSKGTLSLEIFLKEMNNESEAKACFIEVGLDKEDITPLKKIQKGELKSAQAFLKSEIQRLKRMKELKFTGFERFVLQFQLKEREKMLEGVLLRLSEGKKEDSQKIIEKQVEEHRVEFQKTFPAQGDLVQKIHSQIYQLETENALFLQFTENQKEEEIEAILKEAYKAFPEKKRLVLKNIKALNEAINQKSANKKSLGQNLVLIVSILRAKNEAMILKLEEKMLNESSGSLMECVKMWVDSGLFKSLKVDLIKENLRIKEQGLLISDKKRTVLINFLKNSKKEELDFFLQRKQLWDTKIKEKILQIKEKENLEQVFNQLIREEEKIAQVKDKELNEDKRHLDEHFKKNEPSKAYEGYLYKRVEVELIQEKINELNLIKNLALKKKIG